MNDLKPTPRAMPQSGMGNYRTTQRDPYWNFWRVLGLLTLVFVVIPGFLAVACMKATTQALTEATAQIDRENRLQLKEMARSSHASMAIASTPKRYVFTEKVPARSIQECNALTGGIINESWRKCRNGYAATREEWR